MGRSCTNSTRLVLGHLEDRSVPAAHALYAVTQDWGSGFQGQVTLSNDGSAPVAFSTLQFSLPSNITSIWDAKLVLHTGNSYTVTNAGWDASIPIGGSVSFGFVATRGTSTAATDFVLGGVPLGTPSSSPPVTPPISPPPAVPPVAPPVTPSGQVSFKVTSDWGSGLNGAITIKNTNSMPMADWQVAFDFPGQISSLWNGVIVSHVGTKYTVRSAAWNSSIPVGGSVEIGFTSSTGGVTATNLVLIMGNSPVSPPVVPPNQAPLASNDAATTAAGQQVQVNVLSNDADADGDTLTVLAAGPAAHGSVAVNANGTVTYTPNAGFTGNDTFGYTVTDGRGGNAFGTVTVQVTAIPAPPPVTPPVSPSTWPASVFAPYVDATAWPTYDFVATAMTSGVKYFTLAFITADAAGNAAWGGYASYAATGSDFANQMTARITALRALGGDVAVSFGGASGQELAQVITDVSALAAAYRSVIQTYGLTHIDFDIEGAAVADQASITRRSQAIAILQREALDAGRELNVRFTLPVLPTGLDANGLKVIQSARNYGVNVGLVNVMAMDYGDSAAPNPAGRMGDYAIQAGTSVYNQITQLYGSSLTDAERWAMVGVTPMIGLNDVTTEVFDQQEARELEAWAASHHIGLLSMWSLNRDRQNAAGVIGYVDINSSSVLQSPLEFCSIFNQFTR